MIPTERQEIDAFNLLRSALLNIPSCQIKVEANDKVFEILAENLERAISPRNLENVIRYVERLRGQDPGTVRRMVPEGFNVGDSV